MDPILIYPASLLVGAVVNALFSSRRLTHDKHVSVQREQLHAKSETARKEQLERRLQHDRDQAQQSHQFRLEEPHWPLRLSPAQFACTTTAHGTRPLNVLIAPPANESYSDVVAELEEGLRSALSDGYSTADPTRPVRFLGNAWKPGIVGGEATAQALFNELKTEPVLIIELQPVGGDLRIYTAYWGIGLEEGAPHLSYAPLAEHPLPLQIYLAEAVRHSIREWGAVRETLGDDPTLFPQDLHNWDILQKEEKLKEAEPELAKTFYASSYQSDTRHALEAARALTPALQMLTAGMADIYHLYRHGTAPHLPDLISTFYGQASADEIRQTLGTIVENYAAVVDFIALEQPELGIALHLDLARSLAGHAKDAVVKRHAARSLQQWCQARDIAFDPSRVRASLAKVEALQDDADKAYMGRLAEVLKPVDRRSAGEALRLTTAKAARPALPAVSDIHGWPAEQVQALQRTTAEHLGRPVVFRDKLRCGIEGPEMVVIPAGSFLMGSPESEPGRDDDEGPQHRVTFAKPFAIGRYAATFEEYDRFTDDVGYEPPDDEGWGRGRRPVILVSWDDAKAYCSWLNEQTGRRYRLPSEAEWEYACRAGSVTPFHWGSTITPQQANYDGNTSYNGSATGAYRRKTVPVGQFESNAFGLFDMHGNVLEWCEDRWHNRYHEAPADGCVRTDGNGGRRVFRGGSWVIDPGSRRSAGRCWRSPVYRDFILGFRLAQDISL